MDQGHNYNDEIMSDPGFKDIDKQPTIIKVVGVGGGGSNAIKQM